MSLWWNGNSIHRNFNLWDSIMISNLLFDFFLFILVLVGLSCVFVPFFMDINDEINEKFKD